MTCPSVCSENSIITVLLMGYCTALSPHMLPLTKHKLNAAQTQSI